MATVDEDGQGTTDADRYWDESNLLTFINQSQQINAQGDLTTFDSDGFTINWDDGADDAQDSPARECGYLAMGDAYVNVIPTLDAIADVTIDEDATEQTVNLSGITAGSGESQPLRVTATSSSTGLIPNPSVTYTTANATGSIAFTPVSDASGTATITVTVEDGGLDGDLDTGGDNGTFSRTFDVTVVPAASSGRSGLSGLSGLSGIT